MTQPTIPAVPHGAVAEHVCGQHIADSHRWLEDRTNPAVEQWSQEQDERFARHRAQWTELPQWKRLLEHLSAQQWVAPPVLRGPARFYEQLTQGAPHPVLRVEQQGEPARTLIDPARIDPAHRTRLVAWRPCWEGHRLAYLLSTAGSDVAELWVADVADGTVLDGPIPGMRSPSLAWCREGEAFFYVRGHHTAQADGTPAGYGMRVYRHRVGTPVGEDLPVFGEATASSYFAVTTDRHSSRLAVTVADGSSAHNDVHVAELSGGGLPSDFTKVVDGAATGSQWQPRFAPDGTLHLITDHQAPGGRILAHPGPDGSSDPHRWPETLPHQQGHILDDCVWLGPGDTGRQTLLALYAQGTTNRLTLYDPHHGKLTTVPLPGAGAVSGLAGRPEGGYGAWFIYTDRATPPTLYHHDARTGRTQPAGPAVPASSGSHPPHRGRTAEPPLSSRRVRCPATDGTPIDLTLLLPQGPVSRSRPLLLTAYGGFGALVRPAYSPLARAWASAGGIYAVAGVRGGGDHGTDWHRAGRREHKKNSIDDFNAAASWLTETGYTTAEQLAAYGGSHGGLVVTAALTRRPDLYAAVVASGPLCDMVRYEHFGIGHTWTEEFGTAHDPVQLSWLLDYSPYHHVRTDASYPALLLTGAAVDERTGDAHPRKMCAALQEAAPQHGKPVLLRREPDTGHGPIDNATAQTVLADILTFLAAHTGLHAPGDAPPGSAA